MAHALGSVTAALFLCQLIYWDPKATDPDGWVWKTRDEIFQETGLSRREQETARKQLVDAGVLEEKRRGVPARLFYRVDLDQLERRITTYQAGEDAPSREAESAHPDGRIPPNWTGGKRPTNTETTQEITAESTNTRSPQEKVSPNSKSEPEETAQNSAEDNLDEAGQSPAWVLVIEQMSEDLGDRRHRRSNLTRAQNLMLQYDVDEFTMTKLTQAALTETKRHQGQTKNPGAYFFGILEDRLKLVPGAKTSLAGRYWRQVRH